MAKKPTPRPRKKQPFTKKGIKKVPEGPGVYEVFKAGKIAYVGHSKNLKDRLQEHKSEGDISGGQFRVRTTPTTREAQALEKKLIKRHQPEQNEQGK